jgi:hypothetical protein
MVRAPNEDPRVKLVSLLILLSCFILVSKQSADIYVLQCTLAAPKDNWNPIHLMLWVKSNLNHANLSKKQPQSIPFYRAGRMYHQLSRLQPFHPSKNVHEDNFAIPSTSQLTDVDFPHCSTTMTKKRNCHCERRGNWLRGFIMHQGSLGQEKEKRRDARN